MRCTPDIQVSGGESSGFQITWNSIFKKKELFPVWPGKPQVSANLQQEIVRRVSE
jgi:hypothetical protein